MCNKLFSLFISQFMFLNVSSSAIRFVDTLGLHVHGCREQTSQLLVMLKKRQLGRAIPCHCFFCFVLFLYKCFRFFRKFSLSLVVLCAKSFVKVIEKRYYLLSLFKPILQYRVRKSFCMPMSKFSAHLFLHLHSTYWIVFLAGIFFHFSVMFFFLL